MLQNKDSVSKNGSLEHIVKLSQYSVNTYDNMDNDSQKMEKELMTITISEQNLANIQYTVADNNMIDECLPSYELASLFLILNVGLSIPSCYFHFLIQRMVSREKNKVGETLHGRALAIYAKYAVFAHLWSITNVFGIMSYTYPASEILGSWYCYMVQTGLHFTSAYLGSFSLLIAAMKYWFMLQYMY